MKKIFLPALILYTLYSILHTAPKALAVSCGDALPTDAGELNAYVADCNSRLSQLSGQKQTLSQAVGVLATQIKLTESKIAAQTAQLTKLEIEITDLAGKIESLDFSLDDLTKLFVERVRRGYINQVRFPFLLAAHSTGLPSLVKGVEYIEKVRDHDRNLLIALEKSRLDYDEEKSTKEQKQAEIEKLKLVLDREKSTLATQVAAKNKLLEETKNDEKRYQALRQDARNRVAQLASYTSSRGGSSLLSGTTKCDDWGCYYNQRDSQWGNKLIGSSDVTMSSVGCLVTSAAMVASHYGKNITPLDIASSTSPFEYDTADMRFNWEGSVGGAKVSRSAQGCSGNSCLSIIDSELSANRPVIVRISAGNVVGTHFIVIHKKDGDNYLMKDPYESDGNNISFTSKHSISAMTRVDKVSVE